TRFPAAHPTGLSEHPNPRTRSPGAQPFRLRSSSSGVRRRSTRHSASGPVSTLPHATVPPHRSMRRSRSFSPWTSWGSRPTTRMKGSLKTAVGVLLSLVLLWWVLRDVSAEEVLQRIRSADVVLLSIAILIALAAFWIRAIRWGILLQPVVGATPFQAR